MTYRVPSEIETQRLVLRIPEEKDWGDLHEFYSDLECTRYTVGKPMSETESWRKLASLIGHWHIRRYGCYALEEKLSGKVIGVAGFEFPKGWPDPEIQWGLSKKFWRKGYASETVKAITKIGREYLADLNLISIIHPDNIHSSYVAKAVGASLDGEFLFRDITWHIYRHSQPLRQFT